MNYLSILISIGSFILRLFKVSEDNQKAFISMIEKHASDSVDNVKIRKNYKDQVKDLKDNDASKKP